MSSTGPVLGDVIMRATDVNKSFGRLHVLKDVLTKHGWWASTVHSVRGLGKRGYRKVKATDWRYFYRVGEPRKNRNHKKKKLAAAPAETQG